MILSLFLITGCFNDKTEITNERENVVALIETKQENIKVENLGMTFAEFKTDYNNIAKKKEVRKNENESWYIYEERIMHLTSGGVCYLFPCNVAITVFDDKTTGKIDTVFIVSEPFGKTEAEQRLVKLAHSKVFGIVGEVLDTKMSESKYYESAFKRLYDGVDANETFNSGNVKYSSFLDLANAAIVFKITGKDLSGVESKNFQLPSDIAASERRIKQYQDEIDRLRIELGHY